MYLLTCASSRDSDQTASYGRCQFTQSDQTFLLDAFWIAKGAKILHAVKKVSDQTDQADLSLGGGWVWRRCRAAYVTGASN